MSASRMPRLLFSLRFRKRLTVMGMMGHTQGVKRASSPPVSPMKKSHHKVVLPCSSAACWFVGLLICFVTSLQRGSLVARVSMALVGSATASVSADCVLIGRTAVSLVDAAGPSFPFMVISKGVGGMQFWSSQAPYSR